MSKLLNLALLSLAVTQVHAAESNRLIVAPTCLIQKIATPVNPLAESNALVLFSADSALINALVKAKSDHASLCGGFKDVTAQWQLSQALKKEMNPTAFLKSQTRYQTKLNSENYKIQYQAEVEKLFSETNPQNMWNTLASLTNFEDRYANSKTGVQASKWIQTSLENLAHEQNRTDVTIYTIPTGGYSQPSVVMKIGEGTGPGIVVGAHMDTLSSKTHFGHLPGADDDGSGTVTVLEMARTVLSSSMRFKKPIYMIWYAAEEEGLVGSSYVVTEFNKRSIPIDAVIHFDMTGYAYHNDPTMWLISDHTNKGLSDYIATLIKTYINRPVKYTACGYACSDHASWTDGGYVAAMPAEAKFENTNPNLHSGNDTTDKMSLTHMTDYLKLAAAFTVEMAEPMK